MIDRRSDDTLRPVLKEIEHQLDEQIAEACRAAPAADETTGRLERLSETLASAAESARAAAAMRRRLRANKSADGGSVGRHAARDGTRPEVPTANVKRAGTPARGVEARQADASDLEAE